MPGSRYGGIGWTDASGNLWLFGGDGYDSAATFQTPFQGWLNDLWKYDPSMGNWTWEGGSNLENASGVYGTLDSRQQPAYPARDLLQPCGPIRTITFGSLEVTGTIPPV